MSRDGFALVTTLLMVLVLGVIAVGAVWMATSEKKASFAESVHVQSVYSADAGTEAGINFLRIADTPPAITGAGGLVLTTDTVPLLKSQSFQLECYYTGKSFRPGWGVEYPDFDYVIDSTGYASTKGKGYVKVLATRMFKVGY